MSQPVTSNTPPTTVTPPTPGLSAADIADKQLDAQEIYSAEQQAEKFHENLAQISAEVSQGPAKDKMARLALLVAQKNLAI